MTKVERRGKKGRGVVTQLKTKVWLREDKGGGKEIGKVVLTGLTPTVCMVVLSVHSVHARVHSQIYDR